MAQPGGNLQLESSSEHYRELAVDVEGLEEMDWSKGQKNGDSKTIQNGMFLPREAPCACRTLTTGT